MWGDRRIFLVSTLLSCFVCSLASQFSPYRVTNDVHSDPDPAPVLKQKGSSVATNYTPTWDSLDARPLPTWYDEGKIGIFLHWGVFSVPSFSSEWFWNQWVSNNTGVVSFMQQNYPPRFTYQDFGRDFTAEFYDPVQWATLFQNAGAKYIVLTSKHHEGFTLWPSKHSFGWNAGDIGPKRDVLGDLATAIRNHTTIRFGLYHSWFEFYNPLYLEDKKNGYNTSYYVRNKVWPELKDLIRTYQPEVIWSDGDWEASEDYWKSKEFLAWLYSVSPVKDTVVVNDRWGAGTSCKHGGFYSCQDHYNPGHLVSHKWENAMTVDRNSWGYRRNAPVSDYRTPEELISELVSTVSCGGNFLLNVGPSKEGTIAPILEERLLQMGSWLTVNGEAIYETVPWKVSQNDSVTTGVWYTTKPGASKIFAICLKDSVSQIDQSNNIIFGSVNSTVAITNITLIDNKTVLKWVACASANCSGIVVTLPKVPPVCRAEDQWAWTIVINHK